MAWEGCLHPVETLLELGRGPGHLKKSDFALLQHLAAWEGTYQLPLSLPSTRQVSAWRRGRFPAVAPSLTWRDLAGGGRVPRQLEGYFLSGQI